jgi:hypothetical protein|tara:strand:+ start:33 stop:563 length:531 start_codon:yes stop_codon:yes gene_type:complete
MNLDWDLFDWEEIFGTAVACEGLKRAQLRGLRTEIVELAIEKYSGNQLKYVGMNDKLGHDFLTNDPLPLIQLECKMQDKMFQPRAEKTRPIILKNFAGNSKDTIEKKFDYMLMLDTVRMKVGYATFEDSIREHKIQSSNVSVQVDHSHITWICSGIIPKQKPEIAKALDTLLKDLI